MNDTLPIIALEETEGNAPTHLVPLQEAILPYVDMYHTFLWVLFIFVLVFLVGRYIIPKLMWGEKYPQPYFFWERDHD